MFLGLLPFHWVSSTHKMSIFLISIMSASSLLFSVIDQHSGFQISNFLRTDCPFRLCLWLTVVQFSTVSCRLTALLAGVVDPGTDRSRREIILWFAWWFGFRFYTGPVSDATLNINPGLGPALFNTNFCSLVAVFLKLRRKLDWSGSHHGILRALIMNIFQSITYDESDEKVCPPRCRTLNVLKGTICLWNCLSFCTFSAFVIFQCISLSSLLTLAVAYKIKRLI